MQLEKRTLTAKETLLFILLPMLGTFSCQRLFLHLVGVRHVYSGGFLIHHLFMGVLLAIPAAFVLAFRPRRWLVARLAPAVLGIGSAMMLDEVTFLVFTGASDQDYVSALSLGGAIGFISVAAVFLLILYKLKHACGAGNETQ